MVKFLDCVKIAAYVFIAIIFIVILLLIFWKNISEGTISPYTDEKGEVLANSISEKIIVNINGAKNGFIIKGKDINNPVLLFVSSGPGTEDYFYNEVYPDMNLSDYYTVCYWSYRGMGLAYDKDLSADSITTDVLMQDTLAVTEFLKEKFNKDKIYIMGFSGGTNIALQAVKNYPEQYEAYFAMAQVVSHGVDNDTLMYEFMKDVFTGRHDSRNISKLENAVEHIGDGVRCLDWPKYVALLHEAGGGTIKDKSEAEGIVVPIILAKCYTISEKINYIKGMKMYRTTPFYSECSSIDYRELIKDVEVPVYFISGESDYNCPWPLVKEYSERLKGPDIEFKIIENSAHSPLWENSSAVVEYVVGKLK